MDEFNNENPKIVNTDYIETTTNDDNYNYVPKGNINTKPKKTGLLSLIVYGLICAIVGGTISGVASLYVLPKTNFFKDTPLYQSFNNGSSNSVALDKNSPLHGMLNPTSTGTQLSVAEIAKKVGPAVVGVSIKSVKSADPFGFTQKEAEGMGSGVIFNEEGYILTNYHVINGANNINVIFNNGKEVPAKVVNYDAASDLAVIKITEKIKVPGVAEFGNSKDLSVGDPVVAIGNPLGRELLGSVTTGVVSAANREIDSDGSKRTFIQTDAAINPGNSGGPLVNSLGQVIGINSEKLGGQNVEGLGFAIPVDIIKPKLQGLIKPLLLIGIGAIDLDEQTAKKNDLPSGVYIKQVQDFSPAEKAGVKPGDVIVKFDGEKVSSVKQLNDIKAKHKTGDTISVEVSRDGKTNKLSLKLVE